MAKRDSVPQEPESTYPVQEIIARAPTALGVSPEAAAGALSGCTEPMTLSEARQRAAEFLNREVK